jgi:hypothetical protein
MKQQYTNLSFIKFNFTGLNKLWAILVFVYFPLISFGQINITELGKEVINQNFNTLTKAGNQPWENNKTFPGIYVQQGSRIPTQITPTDGYDDAPGFYSFGPYTSSDRSLGGISSSIEDKLFYGFRLKNATSTNITKINVSFVLEQYHNDPGSKARFSLSYQIGATEAIEKLLNDKQLNATTGWETDKSYQVFPPSKGRPGLRPYGDTRAAIIDLDLGNKPLLPGQEIIIRFEDAVGKSQTNRNGMGIDDVSITANPTGSVLKVYHYVGGNGNNKDDLTALENWKTNPNGSGDSPKNFTDDFQLFLIDVPNKNDNGQGLANTQFPELPNNWTVTGQGSKVILGDGTQDFGLTISPTATFTATIDLKSKSTLAVNNSNNYDANGINIPAIDINIVEANSTVVYGGNVAQYVSEAEYYNLEVLGTGSKVLTGGISAEGTLNLHDTNKLTLGAYDLLVGDGTTPGNIISNGGYVVTNGLGSLQRFVPSASNEVLFPVGIGSGTPALIKQNGTGDILRVRVLDGYFANYTPGTYNPNGDRVGQDVVNRTWIVEEEVEGGSSINLALQWTQAAHTPFFIPAESQLTYFTGSDWFDVTNSVYSSANGHQVNGTVSALGVFGVGNSNRNTPLPVELVSFKAARVKGAVELQWQTAMEKNNDFFSVEMSTDGTTFNEVTKVKGAGNSNQPKNYRYLHQHAPTQATYYRLKQTDFDGTFTYSAVVAVPGTLPSGNLAAYPNPSNGAYTIQGVANVTEALVLDVTGRTVLKIKKSNKETGLNLNLADQKAGIYILHLTSPTETQTLRLIKK